MDLYDPRVPLREYMEIIKVIAYGTPPHLEGKGQGKTDVLDQE